MIVRLKGLTGKIETVYKTDSVPTAAANGIQVEENIWGNIEWDFLEDNLRENMAQAGMGRAGLAAPSGAFVHITATTAVKGAGAAYDLTPGAEIVPEDDVLLRVSGHARALNGGTLAYTPISSAFESATFYAYGAGLLFKAVGCRAVLTEENWIPNQIIRRTWDIWGVLAADPTEVALPAIAYPGKAVMPPSVVGASLTLNGYEPADFRNFKFQSQSELKPKPRGNDADGHAGYDFTDWDPQFVTQIDRPPLASLNPWSLRRAGTLFAWEITGGSAANNTVKRSGSNARITKLAGSEDDSFAMVDITARCQNDDEETPDTAYSIEYS